MPPRILILDDVAEVRTALQVILHHAGMDCSQVGSAEEAIALAQRENFDLLTSDISHPGLDGLALLPVWRQRHPHVPVVLVSARLDEKTTLRAFELGAAACCAKPFTVDLLRAAIHAGLAARPQASAL